MEDLDTGKSLKSLSDMIDMTKSKKKKMIKYCMSAARQATKDKRYGLSRTFVKIALSHSRTLELLNKKTEGKNFAEVDDPKELNHLIQ